VKGQLLAFKLTRQQLAERDALAADLRNKETALNTAIAPFTHPVVEALENYNAILEKVRTLAGSLTTAAHEEFDAKSEKWQESKKGIQVRTWIEQWEMSLDDSTSTCPSRWPKSTPMSRPQQAAEIRPRKRNGR
jgi:hypothetical protein